jgi:oligopeptide transport system substrate-binding protein
MRLGLNKFTVSGVIVLLGTLAIMVGGCGTSGGSSVLSDSQQVLRIPLVVTDVDIKTMDPALDADYYSYFPIFMTFPNLVTLDQAGNIQPWAAASMPSFDSATNSYTFKVRPGLKWSDGTPIDANTFAYSINRSLSPCTGSGVTYYMYAIKDAAAYSTQKCGTDGVSITGTIKSLIGDSITVPDSLTLNIKLSQPAPYFLDGLSYPTGDAQPQQLIQQFGTKNWTSHLTDNGGFGGNIYKVKVWDHKGNLDLVRNPNFWGTAPKLREVDFHIYKTAEAEYADYLDGKLDQGVAPVSQYKSSKTRSDFHEVPFLSIGYYQPNWAKAPFNDLGARQAFDLALDKDVLANQVSQGTDIATNHIVPQGQPGYDTSLVGPDGTPGTSGNVTAATKLMDTYATASCKGYKPGSNQFASCPAVTLYDSNSPSIVTQDQAAVQMWQTAFPGYPIKTQFVDFNTLLSLIYSPNAPQIFGIGWVADYPDPQDWLSLQFGTGAINNTGSVVVPAANTLMTQADQDLGSDRMSLYNQAEQLLVTNVAWISLGQGKTFYNLPTYVHNFQFSALGVITLSTWQQMYLTSH